MTQLNSLPVSTRRTAARAVSGPARASTHRAARAATGPSSANTLPPLTPVRSARLFGDDTGASTAEYAIVTMAAVAFAGVLVVIMRSEEVRGILTDLVRQALTVQ